jgi:glycosyltransferase involved in cell wall biosynthesis
VKTAKHILFLPKWYPSELIPNNGNFIENHALAVSKYDRISVLFVHSTGSTAGEKFTLSEEHQHGFPVVKVYFRKPKYFALLLTPLRYWKAQLLGYRQLFSQQSPPDLCHVHVLSRSGLFALYLYYRFRIPYLVSEHWSGYTPESGKFKGVLRKKVGRLLVKKAAYTTVVSAYLKQAMEVHGLKGKYEIIPNVVNTVQFVSETKERQSANAQQKRLYHISNLEDTVKNFTGILRCFHALYKEDPSVTLHVLGDGVELDSHKRYASQLGLPKEVLFFYGKLPMEDVANHLRTACCLVVFSNYETQSLVMLEAFACGIPVIASAVGGIPEHLNDGRGLLVKPKDEVALTVALKKMMATYKRYDSEAIRHYAINQFSEEKIGKRFSSLYRIALHEDQHLDGTT